MRTTNRNTKLWVIGIAGLITFAGCGGQVGGSPQYKEEGGGIIVKCGPACIHPILPVGPLDLDETCRRAYASRSKAVLTSSTDPFSWKCQLDQYQLPLFEDIGCSEQYGQGSGGIILNQSDPKAWQCTKPTVDHCAAPNGTEYVTVKSFTPSGRASAAGYEVIGESSLWDLSLQANHFLPDGEGFTNGQLVVPLGWEGKSFDFQVPDSHSADFGLGTDPIQPNSPAQHALTINAPCGTMTLQTPPLTRVWPSAAPQPGISASSTYVNPGTAVTLTLTQNPATFTPTMCIGNSRVRLVGKQTYDNQVVLDTTYDSNFYSKTITVNPHLTTAYTATTYCNVSPTVTATASVTVDVYGGQLWTCNGQTPPQYWFCRDCPYNVPALTNTLVATACSYDEALNLAETTTFGGACHLADGKCPNCPDPNVPCGD